MNRAGRAVPVAAALAASCQPAQVGDARALVLEELGHVGLTVTRPE